MNAWNYNARTEEGIRRGKARWKKPRRSRQRPPSSAGATEGKQQSQGGNVGLMWGVYPRARAGAGGRLAPRRGSPWAHGTGAQRHRGRWRHDVTYETRRGRAVQIGRRPRLKEVWQRAFVATKGFMNDTSPTADKTPGQQMLSSFFLSFYGLQTHLFSKGTVEN